MQKYELKMEVVSYMWVLQKKVYGVEGTYEIHITNRMKLIRDCTLIKKFKLFCIGVLGLLCVPVWVNAEDYQSLESGNRIEIELQYAESEAFENESLLVGAGTNNYVKRYKYIDSFPKLKGSMRYTRYFDSGVAGSIMYEYMDLFNAPKENETSSEDVSQHLFEGEIAKTIGDALTVFCIGEVISDSRDFYTYKPGAGVKIKFGSIASLSGEAHYFIRGDDAESLGGEMTAMNYILRYRQVLTSHMALYMEYDTVIADARGNEDDGEVLSSDVTSDSGDFNSHTISVQLSRYFDWQAALHTRLRYYHNTDIGIQSVSPSVRLDKYLGWATIVSAKYRYYMNNNTNPEIETNPDDPSGDETVVDNDIKSHTMALQLKRELTEDLSMYARYRYYTNNFDVDMNIYSIGAEISF